MTDKNAVAPLTPKGPVAVLASGGPDSAVLLAEIAATGTRVVPVYVRFGFVWDDVQEQVLRGFLEAVRLPAVDRLEVFELALAPVYRNHWAVTGRSVPGFDAPDGETDLPARNLFLLAQAAVWCHLNGVGTIAIGLIAGHQFPDKRDEFFEAYERALSLSVGGDLRIVRPYARLSKADVLRRGGGWPLERTWSCLDPRGAAHCGACNKCAERRRAFAEAGLVDRTTYLR